MFDLWPLTGSSAGAGNAKHALIGPEFWVVTMLDFVLYSVGLNSELLTVLTVHSDVYCSLIYNILLGRYDMMFFQEMEVQVEKPCQSF